MPREARRRDLHLAGTSTGSESFVLAIRIEKFVPTHTSKLKYCNHFSGLQILSWLTTFDWRFTLPVLWSFAGQAGPSRPPDARRAPARAHRPDHRGVRGRTKALQRTRPATERPWAAISTRPRTGRSEK